MPEFYKAFPPRCCEQVAVGRLGPKGWASWSSTGHLRRLLGASSALLRSTFSSPRAPNPRARTDELCAGPPDHVGPAERSSAGRGQRCRGMSLRSRRTLVPAASRRPSDSTRPGVPADTAPPRPGGGVLPFSSAPSRAPRRDRAGRGSGRRGSAPRGSRPRSRRPRPHRSAEGGGGRGRVSLPPLAGTTSPQNILE